LARAKKRKVSRRKKRSKKAKKSESVIGKKVQRVGWGKVNKQGYYKRGKRLAKYNPARDARFKSKYLPELGKPFSGDDRTVYYVVRKSTGRLATNRVFYSYKQIPKEFKNSKKYAIKIGWI